jgi:phage terminase Nu1 subunit (DNA packaging protein)
MGRQPKDLSVAEFAELIGYTPARVYQLIQDGMPHRMRGKTEKSARVVVADVWRWALDERKREAAKPPEDKPDPETEARTRKRQLEVERLAMELAASRRELLDRAEVEEFERAQEGAFVAFMTGQLQRFEPEIVAAASPVDARRLTERMKREILTARRDYGEQLEREAAAMEILDTTPAEAPSAA